MATDRETEYTTGRYADGFGPGKAGLWFVQRITKEIVALAESNYDAQQIAIAMKAADSNGS